MFIATLSIDNSHFNPYKAGCCKDYSKHANSTVVNFNVPLRPELELTTIPALPIVFESP